MRTLKFFVCLFWVLVFAFVENNWNATIWNQDSGFIYVLSCSQSIDVVCLQRAMADS